MDNFSQILNQQWQKELFLCVGLDSDFQKIPEEFRKLPVAEGLFQFNRAIVDATAEYCAAYKPNSAFYEGYGLAGLEALIKTNAFIREKYPNHLIILDAKRADIGNTNLGYAKAAFDILQAHSITVHPYLGQEALAPFLEDRDHGVFVLCHTSNPGAGEFQELKINNQDLYKIVATRVDQEWNGNQNCGLVVGATYPEHLGEVRKLAPNLPFLIPGIGAQGGDLERTVINGLDRNGTGIIVNASRSIIYASSGLDFSTAAAREAKLLNESIRKIARENGFGRKVE
ncbi:MAG: orotidine-5'-phosphate decarboxylase [Firmicutes bacterium]|nr:orotidine-5'-phosphate decarboxylase [Bacillota bacterium]